MYFHIIFIIKYLHLRRHVCKKVLYHNLLQNSYYWDMASMKLGYWEPPPLQTSIIMLILYRHVIYRWKALDPSKILNPACKLPKNSHLVKFLVAKFSHFTALSTTSSFYTYQIV